MARGYKRSYPATAQAHASGWRGFPRLRDARSFVSVDGHILAYGKDKGPLRAEVFRINREQNGGVNRCWQCGVMVEEHPGDHIAANGEWDHIENGAGLRCDCPDHNGRVSCRGCHSERHVQVEWSKSA